MPGGRSQAASDVPEWQKLAEEIEAVEAKRRLSG
jgi:hypothetical protein